MNSWFKCTEIDTKQFFLAPTSGPEIKNITATSSRSIEVLWNKVPANETNGNITYYLVCYKVQTSPNDICAKRQRVDGSDNRNTVLNDLNEFTNYSVAIQAATSVGPGPPGGRRNVKTFQDGK